MTLDSERIIIYSECLSCVIHLINNRTASTTNWVDAYANAVAPVQSSLKTIWTVTQTNTQGFVTGVAPTVTVLTLPASTTTYVNVKYPLLFVFL